MGNDGQDWREGEGEQGETTGDKGLSQEDGNGGKNEGEHGIHARFEEAVPRYVRRRCIAHMSWRSAEAAFPKMGNVREGWTPISRHLHDGGAWARLKIAAITPVDYGGLALYVRSSPQYAAVFGKPPPRRDR